MQVPGPQEDQFLALAEEGRQPSDLLVDILSGDHPWPLGSLGDARLGATGSHVGEGRRCLQSDYCYLSYKLIYPKFLTLNY